MSNFSKKGEILVLEDGGIPTAGTLAATTVGAALGASASCRAVMIQADPGNTPDILVGDSANQYVRLTPGQMIAVPTSDVSLIYAKTSSSTGNVSWILVT